MLYQPQLDSLMADNPICILPDVPPSYSVISHNMAVFLVEVSDSFLFDIVGHDTIFYSAFARNLLPKSFLTHLFKQYRV